MPRAIRWARPWSLVLFCAVWVAHGNAQVPSPAETRALVHQADQRIRQLQVEADRLVAQTGTLLRELRGLEVQRAIKAEEVKKAHAELVSVNAALEDTSRRLADLEARRVADTPGVRERLVELYKRGRGGYARLLLASSDLQAFGRLSRGVTAVARLDQARFDAHRRTIRGEIEALSEIEQRKKALTAAQADAARARVALDAAVAAQNRRIDELDRRRDLTAQYVGELQEAQAQLQRRVSSVAADGSAALPLAPFRGTLEWPIQGTIVSRFGRSLNDRLLPGSVRSGIEIAASEGQEVRAVHGGTVAFAGPFDALGTLVIVDHGAGAVTLYGHLAETNVAQGARVAPRAVVGRAGRSPAGVQAVYFELRVDGRPVDPVQWLRSSR